MISTRKIEIKESYILIELDGIITLKDAVEYADKAISTCYENDRTKLLIDVLNVTGSLTTLERFEYGSKVAEIYALNLKKFYKPLKIAICGKEPVVDHQRLGETVSVNRGVNQKTFSEREKALTWLLGSDDY